MSVGGAKEPLVADNLLLRGSTLRKTAWAVGVAVNVGRDAKIVQNMTRAPRKVRRGATRGPRGARSLGLHPGFLHRAGPPTPSLAPQPNQAATPPRCVHPR